jgi:hypothetical protein
MIQPINDEKSTYSLPYCIDTTNIPYCMHKADHTEVIQKFKPIIYIQGEGTSFHEGGLYFISRQKWERTWQQRAHTFS